MPTERDRQLTIRISTEELAMLNRIAEDDGLTVSDVIRTYARRTYRERFPEGEPKKRATKGGK